LQVKPFGHVELNLSGQETIADARIASGCQPLYRIHVSDADEAVRDPAMVADWERLLLQARHVNALYAAPPWIAELAEQGTAKLRICSVRTVQGELVGVVPVQLGGYELQFSVSYKVLARRRLQVGRILGSLPMIPDCGQLYANMLTGMLADVPECAGLYCEALPTDSYLWRWTAAIPQQCPGVYLHVTDGPRPWHHVRLTTFDAYLKAMSSKARANVRREVRHLDEHAQGKLKLRRCTAPEQVADFLRQALAVSERSWQHRTLGQQALHDKSNVGYFEGLARRGLLQSYLLMAGETPCAFVIGYRYAGVYHYAEVAFDEAFTRFSPGTVLLYLILEDLHACQGIETLNFGIGDATYKRRFGNVEREDVGCLLMRNQLSSRLLTSSHTVFNRSLMLAKRLLNRKVTK
jgi:CelD/BcsL family acetyltransferase involved in cellulose biosynthesis